MDEIRSFVIIIFFVGMTFLIPAQAKDVELSWENALVYTPGAWLSKSTTNLKLDKTYPAVLYLHGCTGIYPQHDISWAKFLASSGFVVVLPDSMARPNRKSNCDTQKKTATGAFPMAYQYRQAEIRYAREQIRNSSWWDQKNLFLMGHSEGGIATAQSRFGGFNGIVISGWTCTGETLGFTGIRSPRDVPILAIAYLDDLWRKGKALEGRCADYAEGRSLTQVDLIGSGHDTYDNQQARDAVIDFIKSNTK